MAWFLIHLVWDKLPRYVKVTSSRKVRVSTAPAMVVEASTGERHLGHMMTTLSQKTWGFRALAGIVKFRGQLPAS